MAMPPWALLDFPVLVPTDALARPFRLHSCVWGRDSIHPQVVFAEVAVAVGGHLDTDPDWVVATRPRRGIRPLDPDDGDGMDHLTVDPDLQEMAAQAVSGLMLLTMRQDLSGRELAALAGVEDEQSQALGAAVRLRPRLEDPWRREVVRVDGAAFALWVHRQARGWAAIADLGSVTVSVYGRVQPSRWELVTISAQEAAVVFAERRGASEVERGVDGAQGWFGATPG